MLQSARPPRYAKLLSLGMRSCYSAPSRSRIVSRRHVQSVRERGLELCGRVALFGSCQRQDVDAAARHRLSKSVHLTVIAGLDQAHDRYLQLNARLNQALAAAADMPALVESQRTRSLPCLTHLMSPELTC